VKRENKALALPWFERARQKS